MARCPDCIHFSLCDYNTNIAGDAKIKLYYDEGAEKCSFFTPTTGAVEAKQGKWKIKRDDYDCEYMMCSCCKEEFYQFDEDTVDTTPNYCPNCGAKMDRKKAAE